MNPTLFEKTSLLKLLGTPRFLIFLILPVRWFARVMRYFVEVNNGD